MPYTYKDQQGKVIKKSQFHRLKAKLSKDDDEIRRQQELADQAEDWERAATADGTKAESKPKRKTKQR